MRIKVCSIPGCPNCKHLKMLLDRENIDHEYRMYDPMNDDDVAEMAYNGIYDAQFPVVYIDGERLPAMTVGEYMKRIKG